MNDLVANTIAMACHLNASARGIDCPSIGQNEVVFKFHRSVEFWGANRKLLSKKLELKLISTDPDEWVNDQIQSGVTRASLVYRPSPKGTREDRKTAGFVGGGGKFLLVLHRKTDAELWHSMTRVEDKDHPERIWKTGFFFAGKQSEPTAKLREIKSVSSDLRDTLTTIEAFAAQQDIKDFAKTFREAIERLDADDPLAGCYYSPAIPDGLLSLEARRLLAAAELPFVFGAMGSWNDLGFQGDLQQKYDSLSDRLFVLSNEAICAAVSDGASPQDA